MEVTGKYFKGGLGDWGTLPDPQEFEIHMVELNGTNITELIDDINELEKLTLEKLKQLEPSDVLIELMDSLVERGYKIAVCSNSIRKTTSRT